MLTSTWFLTLKDGSDMSDWIQREKYVRDCVSHDAVMRKTRLAQSARIQVTGIARQIALVTKLPALRRSRATYSEIRLRRAPTPGVRGHRSPPTWG
ncbi:MAG: hypothetical protein O3A00_10835, partial [Planctomycetota bacterium]|nr:hypothetical protein [Planctomycetota bacterium]